MNFEKDMVLIMLGVKMGKCNRPPCKACSTTSLRSLEPKMGSVESVTRYSE